MSDPRLPNDVREADLEAAICEQCQISENRIEDMQDALSDALEFLNGLEGIIRAAEFGNPADTKYRNDLLACIERVKKLA